MEKKILVSGNESIGYGAIYADCTHYFGYPITPQNEVIEFFAREFPKLGKTFVQADSEVSSINMLCGAAATGVRVMTSTSSTAYSLMQEGLSAIAAMEVPCVIVDVQRGGPGAGSTQHAQMDYLLATRGSHGDFYNIVLAPFSVQETFEIIQLAFYLADKYRHPVVVLTDGILGQMMESLELKTLKFEDLPKKDWAARGCRDRGMQRTFLHNSPGILGMLTGDTYKSNMERYFNKYDEIKKTEVRCQMKDLDDAETILIAYGSVARVASRAQSEARKLGLKVGMIRPITLWPFPTEIIRMHAEKVKSIIVVEDSMGQMLEDVRLAVCEKAEVHFIGFLDRHLPTGSGMILPDLVLEKIRSFL
ncbi:MAG: 3-methyl-2-oxobutanoate dehydrogenase subunit VorB [Spirochaetota bacterium]|nr:3-methyl-2-oxobutanoate dehydrogenase subunit VorB [Spirochaetota bacterium]